MSTVGLHCLHTDNEAASYLLVGVAISNQLEDFLDREAIVVVDGGDTGRSGRYCFRAYYPGRRLDHHPMSCLGSAIPIGIAAKLAKPDNQVLIYNGDGSFAINGMEFDTAVRHNIPIVAVIVNNGCWGTCKHRQQRLFGREISRAGLHPIRQACGGPGWPWRVGRETRGHTSSFEEGIWFGSPRLCQCQN